MDDKMSYLVYAGLEIVAFACAWQCIIWLVHRLRLPHLTFSLAHHALVSVACLHTLASRHRDVLGVLTLQVQHDSFAFGTRSDLERALCTPLMLAANLAAFFLVDMANSAKHTIPFTATDWVHHSLGALFTVSGIVLDSPNTLLSPLIGLQELSSVFLVLIYMGWKQPLLRTCFAVSFMVIRLGLGSFAVAMKMLQHGSCTTNALIPTLPATLAAAELAPQPATYPDAVLPPWCYPSSLILTMFTWLQLGINVYFFVLIVRKARSKAA
jgi:hypothetical protein